MHTTTEGLSAEIRCDLWFGNSCSNQPVQHEAQIHQLVCHRLVFGQQRPTTRGNRWRLRLPAHSEAWLIHRRTKRHDQMNRCWVDK